jgi:hypothetical protein
MITHRQLLFFSLLLFVLALLAGRSSLFPNHTDEIKAWVKQTAVAPLTDNPSPANDGSITDGDVSLPSRNSELKPLKPLAEIHPNVKLAPQQFSRRQDSIPGEWVLQFNNEHDLITFIGNATKSGIQILDRLSDLLAVRILVDSPEALQELLNSGPLPKALDSNYLVYTPDIPDSAVPVQPANYKTFNSNALPWLGVNGQNSEWGRGVTVAVLDTGIEQHSSIASSRLIQIDLLTEKFDRNGVYAGHGTAVASLVGGALDSSVEGVAPEVDFLSIRVLDGEGYGDSFTLAKGIITAVDLGADELVMSLGTYGDNSTLRQAIDYALDHDVIIIASSGNDGADQVTYPARYEGVLGVGAVDSTGQLLWFSNRGDGIDITAPGYGIYAAWVNNKIVEVSGTSFAVPFVAGTIAKELSSDHIVSPHDAIESVLTNANDAGPPDADPMYGAGILNINRVENQHVAGIFDIAVADYYLADPFDTENTTPLGITIQNRGTEMLTGVDVNISLNGKNEYHYFRSLYAGESVGIDTSFDILATLLGGTMELVAEANTLDNADQNLSNNIGRFNLQVNDTEQSADVAATCPYSTK